MLLQGDLDTSVVCDVNRIKQSLNNLLVNAIKYSPINSEITVSVTAEKQQGMCFIEISNPIDIGDKNLTDSTLKAYDSIGFGLDIVAEVMNAHESLFEHGEQADVYKVKFALPIS